MSARRGLSLAALFLLAVLVPTRPAAAHGAMDSPVSRVVACSSLGGQNTRSAACQAAIAASGAQAFERWDNLPVSPGVAGGKTGRHLIYTIWQSSSTPDTYYSCSDVVFGAVTSRSSAAAAPPAKPAPAGSTDQGAAGLGAADSLPAISRRSNILPLAAGSASAVAVAARVAAFVVRRRRPR